MHTIKLTNDINKLYYNYVNKHYLIGVTMRYNGSCKKIHTEKKKKKYTITFFLNNEIN
jgi:hypothetical protein